TVRSLGDWVGGQPFAVLYADNLIGCDFREIVEQHRRAGRSATVALFDRDDTSQSGVAELDAEGQIVRFVEKPKAGATTSHWVNAGLVVFEPHVAWIAPTRGDIGRDLLPRLIADGHGVAGYRMRPHEALHWVDTPRDL